MRTFGPEASLTDEVLKSLKTLSKDDVESGGFSDVPILVCNNRER
jgi:hypothetical protein